MAWPFTRSRATRKVEPALARAPEILPSRVPQVVARRGPTVSLRMFESAATDRLTASWPSTPIPADFVVRRNQKILVARSREQAANNDYMRGFLRMVRQNIVGPHGVRLQAQSRNPDGTLETTANDAIEAAWDEWCRGENCDVSGKRSFRLLQGVAATGAARDGEFMFREIWGADAGSWGYALQALDPQRCPLDYDEERRPDGSFIRHGIEFNRYGRPLAYLFTTTDEQEADYIYGGRAFQRIPAREIIHGFVEDFTGQKRGLPWAATALWRMRMLSGFENSALVNARVAASKGGFFQWRENCGPEHDEEEDLTMEAEPGVFQELPAGIEFKEWNPQYPNGEFAAFVKASLRGISTGLGVAYNNLANDLEGVNFSSIRQGALDEREHWKDLQEWLIEAMIDRVYRNWLRVALLAGRIRVAGRPLRAEGLEKYQAVAWQARRWAWIDPRADVAAAVEMKNNLMGSFGQFIRDQGRDPQSVWREVAEDIAQMRAAGIPEEYILQAMGRKLNPKIPEQEGDGNATG
ncbi:phage portal protein [Paracoccus litorisediminis]|uniref:Phage portal protein n=1 Tax=Paracoccus litorisediminis TaxID=2006130 RepID=A0A844HQH3_9RHOB|nr:phage portal protein [Paracoccus litorisediminis]MTH60664.1 phage portal protein [Paracoccus litorisediminis]